MNDTYILNGKDYDGSDIITKYVLIGDKLQEKLLLFIGVVISQALMNDYIILLRPDKR